jgi:hypothetical protein
MRVLFSIVFFGLFIASYGQKKEQTTIYFSSNSVQLAGDAERALDNTLKKIGGSYTIFVHGHTDADGNDGFNEDLAMQRCIAVKSYLIDLGIPSTNIIVQAFGERMPIGDNTTPEGKQQNRRVVITWKQEELPSIAENGDIADFYELIKPEPQVFCIEPTRDTVLKCKGGTVISVNRNAFSTNCKDDCVKLEVREILNAQDALSLRLTTTSSGNTLQTGGMFYMEATNCTGQKLNNKEGEIAVFIPRDANNMRLFTGKRDTAGNMDWKLSNQQNLTTLTPDLFAACFEFLVPGKCKFFWCKMARTDDAIAGLFSKSKRAENKLFREQQRGWRINQRNARSSEYLGCGGLTALLQSFGVNNLGELLTELGLPPDMKLDAEQSRIVADMAQKEMQRRIEARIVNGNASLEDLDYYVFRANQQIWYNIDAFLKMDEELLTTIRIDFVANKSTDCKLVFPDQKILLSGLPRNGRYAFQTIPKGEKAILVAMQHKNDQAFLYIQEITITDKAEYTVNLEQQSTEELKRELSKISW